MIDEPRNLTDAADADAENGVGPVVHGTDETAADSGPIAEPVAPEKAEPSASQPEPEPAASSESAPSEEMSAAADSQPVESGGAATAEDESETLADEIGDGDDDPSMSEVEEEEVDTIDEDDEAEESAESDESDSDEDDEIDDDEYDEVDVDAESVEMDWYILKVQSNRERSIAEALQRKIAIEGLDRFFGQVIVPTEKVTEFKGGKKKIVERKLWPGYIVVNMHINDDTWFAVRETSGIGDFTGAAGKPTPMQPHEVAKIVEQETEESEEAPKLAIKFKSGDRVKVKEGNFENFEGEVGTIDEASGRVTVMINIFGRSTPVELEYWQIESL